MCVDNITLICMRLEDRKDVGMWCQLLNFNIESSCKHVFLLLASSHQKRLKRIWFYSTGNLFVFYCLFSISGFQSTIGTICHGNNNKRFKSNYRPLRPLRFVFIEIWFHIDWVVCTWLCWVNRQCSFLRAYSNGVEWCWANKKWEAWMAAEILISV